MQTIRARRLEVDGGRSWAPRGRGPGPRVGGGIDGSWARLAGDGLLLTDAERAFLERRFGELTRRERDVIFALCGGGTNEGIAERMCIALPTLRTHLMRLNQKLGTGSKGDVMRLVAAELLGAYRNRWIGPAGEAMGAPGAPVGLRA